MLNANNIIKTNTFIIVTFWGLFQKELKPILNVAPVLKICFCR